MKSKSNTSWIKRVSGRKNLALIGHHSSQTLLSKFTWRISIPSNFFSAPQNCMKLRLALENPFINRIIWKHHQVGLEFFLYDVLTLLYKVYYLKEVMGDVHYEAMTRIWLVKHKISKYSSMPKKGLGDYYNERLLIPGFNHTRSLTTLFCYLPMKH